MALFRPTYTDKKTAEREPDVLAALSLDRPASVHLDASCHPSELEMTAYCKGVVSDEAIVKMERHLDLWAECSLEMARRVWQAVQAEHQPGNGSR